MSGTPLFMQPLSFAAHEGVYNQVIDALGLTKSSVSERVRTLEQSGDILAKIPPNIPFLPAVDDEIIPGLHRFSEVSKQAHDSEWQVPGRTWCKELLIGDCQMDVSQSPILFDISFFAFTQLRTL